MILGNLQGVVGEILLRLIQITDIEIVKYDVDDYGDLANEKRIKSVPTLIFYNGDNEVDRLIGAVPLNKINELIDKWKNQ